MKTALHNTTWLQRIGFYLLALAVLVVAGWSAGAVILVGLVGALALVVWWVVGLGWKSTSLEEAEWTDTVNDPACSFSIGNVYHSDD